MAVRILRQFENVKTGAATCCMYACNMRDMQEPVLSLHNHRLVTESLQLVFTFIQAVMLKHPSLDTDNKGY